MRTVTMMLKTIHAQESKQSAREKAASTAQQLREMRLSAAAQKVEESIEETLTYMDYPTEHWNRIRTNNTTERVNREIKRQTKAIGAFPDVQKGFDVGPCQATSCSSVRLGIQAVSQHEPPV